MVGAILVFGFPRALSGDLLFRFFRKPLHVSLLLPNIESNRRFRDFHAFRCKESFDLGVSQLLIIPIGLND